MQLLRVLLEMKQISVEQVNPIQDEKWDQQVSLHDDATVFHSSAWSRVLEETYGHFPCCLRLLEGEKLLALVPMMEVSKFPKGLRGVGMPFSDSCTPLLYEKGCEDEVLNEVRRVLKAREWRYAEIRATASLEKAANPDGAVSFYGHELSLSNKEEDQMQRMRSSARRCLRQAVESGFSVSIASSWSALQKFFGLHEKTRRRHGAPPQPLSFFKSIYRHILKSGKGFVSLVEKNGLPVSGAVFFHSKTRATYKFGASDERYLGSRPNHLAMWEGIRSLIAQGCKVLEFGRTDPSQDGLRRFKKSWGANEVNLLYLRSNEDSDRWEIKPESHNSSLLSGFRFMPLPINRLAGRMIYPHLD